MIHIGTSHTARIAWKYRFGLVFLILIGGRLCGQSMPQLNMDSLLRVYHDVSQSDGARLQAVGAAATIASQTRPQQGIALSEEYLALGIELNDSFSMADAYFCRGLCRLRLGHTQAGTADMERCIGIASRKGITMMEGVARLNVAASYVEELDITSGLDHAFRAVELFREFNDSIGLVRAYADIGVIFMNIGDSTAAAKYLHTALNYMGDREMPDAYMVLAQLNVDRNPDSAAAYLAKVPPAFVGEDQMMLHTLYSETKAQILINKGQPEAALDVIRPILDRLETDTAQYRYEGIFHLAGTVYLAIDAPAKAVEYCRRGYEMAVKKEGNLNRWDYCRCLANAYRALGDYKNATKFKFEAAALRDSAIQVNTLLSLGAKDKTFELKQEFIADSIAAAQKVFMAEEEGKRLALQNKTLLWGGVIFGVVALLFVLFAMNRGRVFRRQRDIIQRQERLLRQEYLNLKEFTENAAHEMQSPMAIIQSKLDILLQSSNLTEVELRQIGAVSSATMRLSAVNRSLLLLAKIENNQFPIETQVQFGKIVAERLADFSELFAEKGISVNQQIDATFRVQSNPFLANLIVSNLVRNALAHNVDEGRVEVELSADRFRTVNTGRVLTVPPETLFERFQKGGHDPNSTGLGLALVKKACEAHNWGLSYTHQEGTHTLEVRFA